MESAPVVVAWPDRQGMLQQVPPVRAIWCWPGLDLAATTAGQTTASVGADLAVVSAAADLVVVSVPAGLAVVVALVVLVVVTTIGSCPGQGGADAPSSEAVSSGRRLPSPRDPSSPRAPRYSLERLAGLSVTERLRPCP